MYQHGFFKIAAASPKLSVANPQYNINEIIKLVAEAEDKNAGLIVFPELSITGYTCADLFYQKQLLDKAQSALKFLMEQTQDYDIMIAVGMPVKVDNSLFNCAIILKKGNILGIIPKIYIPAYSEYYEKRWFTSGHEFLDKFETINFLNSSIPFGSLIFNCTNIPNLKIGFEICEDLWAPIPPGTLACLDGATIIGNLSASNDSVSKSDYRHDLIKNQSGRCISGYIYASCGIYESTTDLVFGGDCVIAENGTIINKSKRFTTEGSLIFSEIDLDRLSYERLKNKTFTDNGIVNKPKNQIINFSYEKAKNLDFEAIEDNISLKRFIDPAPFVPDNPATRNERCEEIFNIQASGLAKRLYHINCKNTVIGISGGLDSTLALLVTVKAYKLLNIPLENIYTITMPGFGTTDKTLNNAISLCNYLGTNLSQISIVDVCRQHFKDIDFDESIHNVTYENCQARERTQILMDMANKINGIVVGTGDLSEVALGWSTYNGDHMSMYAVNCSVPKTLVKSLVEWVSETQVDSKSKEVLKDIINTPVSPELLPPDENGNIVQKTEDIVGPYELHDFFLYHAVKYGAPPAKVLFLAKAAFKEKYDSDTIKKWLKNFYRRFFTQQFKRSCIPDGPKVGSISLSPRGDWRMPSDASYEAWLEDL